MRKLNELKFWIVAFCYIVFNTMRNRNWNMIYVDFDNGEYPDGRIKRKQLIAKKTCGGLELSWQDLSKFFHPEEEEDGKLI
jgi:hypothetical protein